MTTPHRLSPLPGWATDPAARAVINALSIPGFDPRFVGGCVRNALLGRDAADVDIATPLKPEAVMVALHNAGLGVIPTGLQHGTVTARSHGRSFEITTLRVDVETDGRHAIVEFTADWRADAARRDFTMNALSADPEGAVHDYFGGVADALAGRVRFVGDPAQRIAEDALRILRFFRFHAHYGQGELDPAALAACAAAVDRLDRLSGERVQAELLKLLAAPDPVPVWRAMVEAGIARHVIGEDGDIARLQGLVRVAPGADPLLRLAALLRGDAAAVAARLKLSNDERDRLVGLRDSTLDTAPDETGVRLLLYRHGRAGGRDRIRLAWAAAPKRWSFKRALAALEKEHVPTLPVRGRDVVALGVSGPAVGRALAEVERWWIAQGLRPGRDESLDRLRELAGV
ncbi:MAG: CCA tRNA nucleotidyltransferase [Inquilinus limosus]|uniref:CCA tRNA nucleotidyltransferase n=1 Tax=Inquilinus limosus TaxID=171674 RepID=A0A952FP61_9PROT|nr:CCA tRNA nucleotidyltransferase [Inquilinus limosus]